jgi:NAD(P)-dependent dehydrogenase (short-subunit alcohol dehydrogenase family)
MTDQTTPQDPRSQQPGEDAQSPEQIPHPGLTRQMDHQPDHGEKSYTGADRLAGKRALITGADSGIGRAVALAFARVGADVVLSYLPEEEADAKETARLVEEAGRRAVHAPGDIRDEQTCVDLVETTVRELGGIDVLVNNAAYQMAQEDGLLGITTEQLDRVFKTNLYALFWITKAAVPHMQPGSSIITTASIQAVQPSPNLLDYAMTKAAQVAFTKGLADEFGEKGIRVNAVAPGPIWTPLIPATGFDDTAEFGQDTPLGRAGQPAELAPAYVMLASHEASYISGAVVPVTGGKPF